MKKGVIVLVVLMAVIFCGNVSAMYQYQPTYPPENYQPYIPPTITEEDWDNLLAGGSGSSNVQEYINRLHPPSQETPDDSNIQSGDSSQATSTGSSESQGSSPSSDTTGSTGSSAGTAVNNSPNTTTTESGTQVADDNGKADESSKVGTQSSNDTPWGAYAVGGIISILAIGAVGFYYRGNLFRR
jgi:hypothetical protein